MLAKFVSNPPVRPFVVNVIAAVLLKFAWLFVDPERLCKVVAPLAAKAVAARTASVSLNLMMGLVRLKFWLDLKD